MPDQNADADVSSAYMQHAQNQSADATIERFMREMQQGQPAETPASRPSAAQPDRAPTRITVRPLSVMERLSETVASAGRGAGAVAADIGTGFTEAPSAIAGGVNDAVRNAVGGAGRAIDSVAEWLNENVADLKVSVPKTQIEFIDRLIENPALAIPEALPEKVGKPKSVTGTGIREAARFLTGFVPAFRAMKAVGPVAGSLGAGAVSDFATSDPNESNLSGLIQSVPALENPVTAFLKTDPDSPEAVNRFRNAVEGLGFGAMTEGIVRGVRAIAHSKRAPKTEAELQGERYGEASGESATFLGKPDAPLVSVQKLVTASAQTATEVPDQVAARGVAGQAAQGRVATAPGAREPEVFINWSRIDSPDDVQTVMRDMANAFKGDIDTARRGVQTNDQTKALADNLGMTVEDLLARRAGKPMSAEESLAARRLWATSAEKLLEAAKRASDANAGPVDLHNFRRMMAIHHAIQSEVIAARTETARALQAWSIPAGGGGVEKARMIEQMLDGAGGAQVSAELARRMASLQAEGISNGAMADVVRRGWAATSMDAVKEAYVLGLLWNPTTHLVNIASNTAVAFQSIYERAIAKQVGDFLGSAVDARVADGEAMAMTYGLVTSLRDAVSLSVRALRTGETGASMGKIDLPHEKAISSAAVSRERGLGTADAQAFAETPMGRGLDFMGAVNGVPGRLLGAQDEFFKTVSYRAEVHAQALRQATQEGLSGSDRFRRMAELVNNPPEHIKISASDAALYNTFTSRPGDWAQGLLNLRNGGTLNPTFLVLPFIKTPANILRYTFERTPLAPLVGQWRDDIAAGGARRDLALAKMATGTALLSVGLDLASSGMITGQGPSDAGKREALQRSGWQPNSVVIEGKYYSFNRADPVGMVLGFAGAISERMKSKDNSPEDFDEWEEILASGIGALSASVVDKTYFQGVANVLDMLGGAERGVGGVERYIDRQTGSLMPFSSLSGTMKRFTDPVTREVNSPWDAIQAKIAGLSDNLPPARDLWGNERKPQEVYGRVYDALSAASVTATKDSPIDAELVRLDAGIRRIQKKGTFSGVEVNFRDYPQVYDEYVRLAGNELKHPAWGMGVKDYLDAVVSGRHSMSQVYNMYSDGPEGGKASFIKNAISEYRRMAQEQIMSQRDRWPEFVSLIEGRQDKRQELKLPAGVKLPRRNDSSTRPHL